ncbi:MAG: LemA family protein, partial [Bacteroidetes bacterium]|nr:LemA family protein [Bacteroidota bacterium]
MKKNLPLYIALGVMVILVLWFISAQNSLVTLEENVNAKWSQVENVYQRRLDLIPNLVATVKGYASQEKELLTEITELRSRVGQMNVSSDILDDPAAFERFQQ